LARDAGAIVRDVHVGEAHIAFGFDRDGEGGSM